MRTVSPAKDGRDSTWRTAWISDWPVSTRGCGSIWRVIWGAPPPVPVVPVLPPPAFWHLALDGCLAHLAADDVLLADAIPDRPITGRATTTASAVNRARLLRTF